MHVLISGVLTLSLLPPSIRYSFTLAFRLKRRYSRRVCVNSVKHQLQLGVQKVVGQATSGHICISSAFIDLFYMNEFLWFYWSQLRVRCFQACFKIFKLLRPWRAAAFGGECAKLWFCHFGVPIICKIPKRCQSLVSTVISLTTLFAAVFVTTLLALGVRSSSTHALRE